MEFKHRSMKGMNTIAPHFLQDIVEYMIAIRKHKIQMIDQHSIFFLFG